MQSNEVGPAIFVGIMIFLFGVVGGLFLSTTHPRYMDTETVKAAPTECQLRRFGHAQKYVEACTPAFKSAAP